MKLRQGPRDLRGGWSVLRGAWPRNNGPEKTGPGGFTLLELMFVMTIILILASFAVPTYTTVIKRAREAVLRNDLYTMRHLIDEYTVDKQQPPSSLQDLVDGGYLHGGIPVDPITGSNQTWQVDIEDVAASSDLSQEGVVDVHSGSDAISLEGTPYSSW
ncbi:MAG: type II secretion system protein [Terriglobia bacterium]